MVSPPNYSLLLIMACFWLVYFLVSSLLIKPLGTLIDERERRVREARDDIEKARQSFDDTMTRCEKELAIVASAAQKERAELRGAGEAARRAQLDGAREKGQVRLATLAHEIEQSSAEAQRELRTRAELLSRELAERLLGRRLAS